MNDRAARIKHEAEFFGELAITQIEAARPKVLLLGPSASDNKPGGKLRTELKRLCWEIGTTLVAEHEEIEKEGRKTLQGENNLTGWEAHIAKNSHLVVIIPDSPGSFAELGFFSMQNEICPKMVILFDKQYKKDTSYIQRGPRRNAAARRANILFVDYNNPAAVWRRVSKFVQAEKAKIAGLL
jgi:hypothetical protein